MSDLTCPKLDQWIHTYYELSKPNHTLILETIERDLEKCLEQERLNCGDPYPTSTDVSIELRDICVYNQKHTLPRIEGGDSIDQLLTVDPQTYYIYVKRDPCPYLSNTRKLLQNDKSVELRFTDDDVVGEAMLDHRQTLLDKARHGPLSSPQIFYGATFIPDGSEGLARYLASRSEKEVVEESEIEPKMPTVLPLARGKPELQPSVDWFIYGTMKCKYCQKAVELFGQRAHFVNIYGEDDSKRPVPIPIVLDPMHKQLVGADSHRIVSEIDRVRTTEGVPVIYHGDQRVPNNFEKLAEYAREALKKDAN